VKEIVVVGGPNGAGKTSTAQTLLPSKLGVREFVNADEIARGLSPFNVDGAAIAAGRLMLRRMNELTGRGESFAFETNNVLQLDAYQFYQTPQKRWMENLVAILVVAFTACRP
jgi:predicted ABC-type ATPase